MVAMPQPAGRTPAPPPLDRVQAFVNTVDLLDGVAETLADAETAAAWLESTGRVDGSFSLTSVELDFLVDVREAVRLLCHHNRSAEIEPSSAHGVLNAAADRCELAVDFRDGGRLRPAAAGLDRFVGELLAIIQASMLDGSWRRLKACAGCGWVFHDGSRSRISRWCSMSICGNRAKVRAHRERHSPRHR
jgi:predicted RNA-binding Zn ribbon-like protein